MFFILLPVVESLTTHLEMGLSYMMCSYLITWQGSGVMPLAIVARRQASLDFVICFTNFNNYRYYDQIYFRELNSKGLIFFFVPSQFVKKYKSNKNVLVLVRSYSYFIWNQVWEEFVSRDPSDNVRTMKHSLSMDGLEVDNSLLHLLSVDWFLTG